MKANELKSLYPEMWLNTYNAVLFDIKESHGCHPNVVDRLAYNAAFIATSEFHKALKQKLTDFQNFLILDGLHIDKNEAKSNIEIFTEAKRKPIKAQ